MHYNFVLSCIGIRIVGSEHYSISYFQAVKRNVVAYDNKIVYVKIGYHTTASNYVERIWLTKSEANTEKYNRDANNNNNYIFYFFSDQLAIKPFSFFGSYLQYLSIYPDTGAIDVLQKSATTVSSCLLLPFDIHKRFIFSDSRYTKTRDYLFFLTTNISISILLHINDYADLS